MPSHQERRDPLPEGYQFGDAATLTAKAPDRFPWLMREGCNCVEIIESFERKYPNARLGVPSQGRHYSGCVSNSATERVKRFFGWNVIEGELHEDAWQA